MPRNSILLVALLFLSLVRAQSATLGEALNAADLTWSTAGAAPWYAQTITSRDGAAAQSGLITHNQSSALETSVEGPGTLIFSWRIASETNADHLIYSANASEQRRVSGFVSAWQQVTNYLPAGSNHLSWVYSKNASGSTFSDAGWLDQVSFVPGGVSPSFGSQPTNLTVTIGGNAILATSVNGTPPLSLQWSQNGTNIAGATNAVLTLFNLRETNAGVYTLSASNQFGGLVSSSATLSVSYLFGWGAGVTNGFTVPHHGQSRPPAEATNLVMMAAGGNHSLALNSDGRVFAWGLGTSGQTNVPASATNVMLVSAGDRHNIALRTDGTVIAWGQNSNNKLNVPATLKNVISVAAGWEHSLALRSDGNVVAWGAGTFNYNASPNYGQSLVPASATGVTAIAAGAYHSMALRQDGTVVAWGRNSSGQTNVPAGLSNVVAIAAGGLGSAALRGDGTVVAWGNNSHGQTNVPPDLTNAVALAAGENHFVALRNGGTVTSWGQNSYGQTNVPAGATNIVAVSAGQNHGLALADDHSLSILVPPWSQLVSTGGVAVFQVTVAGSLPRTFQWQRNQTDIPDATNRWLTLTNLQLADEASFRVSVSNAAGVCVSPEAALDVMELSDALNATNLSFSVFGSVPWTIQTTQTLDEVALVAGPLLYQGAEASLETRVDGPGTLSFWWCGSGFYSTLTYLIDGMSSSSYSSASWQQRTIYLPAGRHYVSWSARNTGSSAGTGRAFLDQVQFVPGATPATISSQPINKTVAAGDQVTLSVAAFGTTPLSYQWRFAGTNLPGATSSSLTVNDVQVRHAGTYSVMVTNAWGVAVSSNATVSVTPSAPVFVVQPLSQKMIVGGSVTLAGSAKGSAPILYQWQHKGGDVSGATNTTLVLTNLQAVQGGDYALIATNEFGAAPSSNGVVSVYTAADLANSAGGSGVTWSVGTNAPWFPQTNVTHDGVSALQSGVLANGQKSVLRAELTGPATVTFWWKTLGHSFWSELDFAVNGTNQAVIAGDIDWQQQTYYLGNGANVLEWLMIRDSVGGSTTDAGWLDQVAVTYGGTPVTIVTNPAVTTTNAGNNVTFKVAVTGTAPFSYQWYFDGEAIVNATNATLALVNVQTNHAGAYSVSVHNEYGPTIVSEEAMLTVTSSGPVITSQPGNRAVTFRTPVTLQVAAKGSSPLSYQWLFDSIPLEGATESMLIFDSVQSSNTGDYRVIITNSYGAVTSVVARLEASPTVVMDCWPSYPGGLRYSPPLGLTNIISVAAGLSHSIGLRSDGTVAAWGFGDVSKTNVPANVTNVIAISAGEYHSLALRLDGTVVGWGENFFGQTDVPPDLTNVIAIASSGSWNLALRSDGTVLGWGNNFQGPLDVPAGLSNVVSIALGFYDGYALKVDGTLVLWGNGPGWTQNGIPQWLAVPAGLSNIAQIVTGSRTSWVVDNSDSITSWGAFWSVPPWYLPSSPVSISASHLGSSSGDYLAAVGRDRSVGFASSASSIYVPRNVNGLPIDGAVSVYAAPMHAIVLLNDGRPYETRKLLNRTAPVGSSVAFSCGILGAAPMTFQWLVNGTNIPGATNFVLVLPDLDWSDAGDYQCLASNHLGNLLSAPATLTVVRSTPQFSAGSAAVSEAGFRVDLTGLSGAGPIVIYASSNLLDWLPVFTNPPHKGAIQFVDPAGNGQSERYFRAVEQ